MTTHNDRDREAGQGRLSATRASVLDGVALEMDQTEDQHPDVPSEDDYMSDIMWRFAVILYGPNVKITGAES